MDIITEQVIFTGIVSGNPPRLLFHKNLERADGTAKVFTEAARVLNEALLQRIERELRAQDEIELTVEYNYEEPGWPSRVIDFQKTAAPKVQLEKLTVA